MVGTILMAVFGIFLVAMAFLYIVSRRNEQARGSRVDHFPAKANGGKVALLVYQPSALGKAMDRLIERMTDRLLSAGFSVDRTVAGPHVPVIEGEYDLMLFGSSVYMGQLSQLLLQNLDEIIERQAVVGLFSLGLRQDDDSELTMATTLPGVNPDSVMKFFSGDPAQADKLGDWLAELIYRVGQEDEPVGSVSDKT